MESAEIEKQLGMTYDELVGYLIKKYGPAKFDYFRTETCKSRNPKASRTSEGLICHHIDEDKAIMLCNDHLATRYPFEYQKAERLVYCNTLEHLMLHIKIAEKVGRNRDEGGIGGQGIGGAFIICEQINDYYGGVEYKKPYMIERFNIIKDNFEDYIEILKYFLRVAQDNPQYKKMITKERLSSSWLGLNGTVKKVFEKL